MGSIHYLLCAEEDAVIGCLRDLQRFGETFEQFHLDAAERALAGPCGSSARAIVSQGLFLARIMAEDGVSPGHEAKPLSAHVWRRADKGDMRLLALVEAAQSSRSRLESLLREEARPSPELVFVLIRFAALLLSAGLRLPRRELRSRRLERQAIGFPASSALRLQVT